MAADTTPVIIGVGRVTQRAKDMDVAQALDPIQLMAQASRIAMADAMQAAGTNKDVFLRDVDHVSTIAIMMEERVPKEIRPLYKNPSLALAKNLGISQDARFAMSYHGGDKPQLVVNELAERLANGEARVGIVAGGECLDTFMRATKLGRAPAGMTVRDAVGRVTGGTASGPPISWGDDPKAPEPVILGHVERIASKQEARHGMASPPNTYALLDQALRHHLGRSAEEHDRENAQLFSGLSEVAAGENESKYSWFPTSRSPEELQRATDINRAVTQPGYTKYLNAAQDVDQAAAVIMATADEARALGVPEAQWVYLHGSAEAEEAPRYLSERPELHRSRAMHAVAQEVERAAKVPLSRCDFLEIYSCFPVAVQVAAREFGLDEDRARDGRSLTLLGGLPYHGGAGNSYALFGIVAMCERLRAKPGSFGLVTANGGWLTKHSAGIYSTTPYSETHPGIARWQRENPETLQQHLDETAQSLTLEAEPAGACVVETCTVEHGRQGPVRALFVGRMTNDDSKRFIATSSDKATMDLVISGNGIGKAGSVSTSNGRSTFEFDMLHAASKL